MVIQPLLHSDLPQITHFQPPDWPDVFPSLRFYIDSPFCHPVKAVEGGEIVGVGSAIVHSEVAWLATIITDPEKRNRGIGTFVTQALIESLENEPCETIMLVATPLGEYVYKKLGFATEGEYVFFRNVELNDGKFLSENIVPYHVSHLNSVLQLDKAAAGEDRGMRIREHLEAAKIYARSGRVEGFYLPAFGEGLVVAENAEAGAALLDARHCTATVTILPKENTEGINYLLHKGFSQFRTASRMRLGKPRPWKPQMIYSRISGAIG